MFEDENLRAKVAGKRGRGRNCLPDCKLDGCGKEDHGKMFELWYWGANSS